MANENLKTFNLGLLVFDKRNLVQISTTNTVEEALFVLQRENILALPVYDAEKNEFVRILTIFDIMTYVAFGSFKIDQQEPDAFSVFESAKIPVSELISRPIHAEDERVWIFKAEDQLHKVFEPMSKGVHRVLVELPQEEGKTQYRIVTQMDVVRFLSSYILYESISVDGSKAVKDLNIIQQGVKTAHEHTSALEVYRKLHYDDLAAIPLVDNDGKLVATISASDLRGLRSYQLKSILLPAFQFLYLFKGPAAKKNHTCTANDSLTDVLTKLTILKVHRLWVVNDQHHPVGVISLTDIIGKFVSYE